MLRTVQTPCRCPRGRCRGAGGGRRDPLGYTGWSPDCHDTATLGRRSLQGQRSPARQHVKWLRM